jgi:branched-chain amino acid transport system ATP-binding protein
MEMLRVEELSKSFAGLTVFNGLAFGIESGERVAIIGPNGAGKTTLFNVLAGQLPATSGRIYMKGQEITAMPAHRRAHIGLTRSFQMTRLFDELTVLENILLALHGIRPSRFQMFRPPGAYGEIRVKGRRLLESLNLWEKCDEPLHCLSYGEQRRMEIALSLASEPEILLLDEPTAGLSIDEIKPFMRWMRDLAKDTTIFFSAHDMDVVFGLAGRILVLYTATIIAQGTPEEIQNNPKVREVYLGSDDWESHSGIV